MAKSKALSVVQKLTFREKAKKVASKVKAGYKKVRQSKIVTSPKGVFKTTAAQRKVYKASRKSGMSKDTARKSIKVGMAARGAAVGGAGYVGYRSTFGRKKRPR